ncbi:hypothetical protein [Pseudovibrio sp. Tun.PSC04-5.I4]|uniref:hypothetical protein n=1 Tax=Pseudovibrio sp. Tun.PSC04-5.I4 TaxID=1798213 RepID=UPI00088627C9|nr:hypothetical protein [Pseudovibrio sp. Tun.PSC04-5.I4]SDQ99229.1 hypothetical protein SAMN04515695_2212 [Pseudovibrio sp. Tun.PSC04-5.I4]
MIYSPSIRRKIKIHDQRRMSHRRITQIFGVSLEEVAEVVGTEKSEHVKLSGVPMKDGRPLHPVKAVGTATSPQLRLLSALEDCMQVFALDVAKSCNVHVSKLFTAKGQGAADIFARGCFFYGLSCRFRWNYDAISQAAGVSVDGVVNAIKHYCEKMGAPRPKELSNARRAVA